MKYNGWLPRPSGISSPIVSHLSAKTTKRGHPNLDNPLNLLARPLGLEPRTFGFVVRKANNYKHL